MTIVSDSKKKQAERFFVFGGIMLIFFIRFVSGTLFSQIGNAPFLFGQNEIFYNLFLQAGISQFILSHPVTAITYDVSLFLFPILFIATGKNIFAVLAFILSLVYFLTFNIITGHHYHTLVGVLVITIPFWFKDEKRFSLMWEGVRFYLFYIFVSAALWKIFRGSVFYEEQLSNILKSQHQFLLSTKNADYVHIRVIQYLIENTKISHAVLIANVLLQLSFAVGFFTRRFDRFLFLLTFLFMVTNYIVMGIVSSELLILTLTLLNWGKLNERFSKLNPRSFRTQKMVG